MVLVSRESAGSSGDVKTALLGLAMLPALAAIAVWVLVLLRFVQLAWTGGQAAMVSVTPEGLHVVGGLLPRPAESALGAGPSGGAAA